LQKNRMDHQKLQSEAIIKYLTEIMAGRCEISDAQIEEQYKDDAAYAEILMGLRHLHEDLIFRQEEQKKAESRQTSEAVIKYLTEIMGGHCEISDESIEAQYEKDPAFSEILMGLRHLHEDLLFRQVEQQKAEKRLKSQIVQVTKVNRELEQFAYIASHDLKEPLRGIRSNSTFLLKDYKGRVLDEGGEKRINRLISLSNRMEKLVSSLLDYSKIEGEGLEKKWVGLEKVISDAIENLRARIEETHTKIDISPQLPEIECDSVRLIEVFVNLVSNGIKYNDKPQKTIEMGIAGAAELMANHIDNISSKVFYVRDNGIGIPTEHLDNIFKLFKRLHARDEYEGGTGAGLTIAKKIVEEHGGKIWVSSKMGQGSTFYFTLGVMGREEGQKKAA